MVLLTKWSLSRHPTNWRIILSQETWTIIPGWFRTMVHGKSRMVEKPLPNGLQVDRDWDDPPSDPLPLEKTRGDGRKLSFSRTTEMGLPSSLPMAHAVCCMFPTCFPCVPRGLSLLFHGFVHPFRLLQELAEIRGQRGCRSNKASINPYFSWQECCTRR